ncbi:MAG: IS110 family transposase [Anaerolineae bacterium]|nr:IS110 family transposase [Anaerolineae bacterium]
MTIPTYHLFVGVDVAAATASVAIATTADAIQPAWSIQQDTQGWHQLQTRLLQTAVPAAHILVVMEATGTYWMQLALHLHQAGFAVSVINPLQAKRFAQALLKRRKTDALDAQLLAQLAATLKPAPWSPPPAVYDELLQRLQERDQLLETIHQNRNRLHALRQRPQIVKPVQQRMERHILFMEKQIALIDAEIRSAMSQDADWAAAAKLLLSIAGIGFITAAWILTATVNFAYSQTAEQVVAYAGLAPQPFDSGSSIHRPATLGHAGHPRLRTALYMATLSAAQHNPIIKSFYSRLRQAGKPNKVARCAAARKLLCIAFAVVSKHQPFDPDFHSKPCFSA